MKQRKRDTAISTFGKRFEWSIFILTFLGFGALVTIQMRILGNYISYREIPLGHIIAVIAFWILTAVAFTLLTIRQINRRYKDPIEQFAGATAKVAAGDFSVYVSRKRAPAARQDPLDQIFGDFNKMVEALGSIETLKTDFFSNVSHEIKTPLSAIQSYAELLQRDDLPEAQRKAYAASIMESTQRLSALITNLLKLNKLEKQTIRPAPAPYDLCAQLLSCALQFENLWEKKGIEFVAELEDRRMIDADEDLLEIVWNNLFSNAFKFTQPGGTVTLTQTSAGGEIVVAVSDTGCGMSREATRHVFDKFYQEDASHATEGNGLGLALVLRILQLTDGSVCVDSTPGKGSTFTVRMPAGDAHDE